MSKCPGSILGPRYGLKQYSPKGGSRLLGSSKLSVLSQQVVGFFLLDSHRIRITRVKNCDDLNQETSLKKWALGCKHFYEFDCVFVCLFTRVENIGGVVV